MRWSIAVVSLAAACGHAAVSRDPLALSTDVDDTLRTAVDEHRPALVFAGAAWDVNSEHLERDVFCDRAVVAAMSRFVGAKIDYTDETPAAERVMARVGATAVPTLVLFASDGHVVDRIVGLVSASELAQRLERTR